MQELVILTGMILKTEPIGEYDRRVVLLTLERGKISAFAKGARRQNSRMAAATTPFSFGEFKLYEGKSSYNMMEANINNYFEGLRSDYIAAYYGMYFMEVADYYARENNDDRELLKLLYQSLKALLHPSLDNRLVQSIFELKTIVIEGEYPGVPKDRTVLESTAYTMEYIAYEPVEKLYNFQVSKEVLEELSTIAESYRKRFMDRQFKSLEIIKTLG